MSDIFHTETYTDPRTDIEYEVKYWYDPSHGAPDTEFDGHGHILTLDFDPTDPDAVQERMNAGHSLIGEEFAMKAPLMRLLSDYRFSNNGKWYDFVTSMNIATTEWGVAPDKAYDAVEKDYEYLRDFYRGDWHWIGITIRRADNDDPWHENEFHVGGFESMIIDDAEGKREVLDDMIIGLESEIRHEKHMGQLSLPLDTAAVVHLTNYR